MKTFHKYLSVALVVFLVVVMTHVIPSKATPNPPMDVRALQTCLKEKGSSLDVLVLMDSSRSLRDSKKGELVDGETWKGSDPQGRRGPILASSLNILRDLAEDSGSSFRVNLKNFGNNSGDSLKELQKRWKPWTEVTAANSESVLGEFVESALYEDSDGTDWASGLATAKIDFNQRIYEAERAGSKSCSIMFWITDGVPSNPGADRSKICSPESEASIDWFRERNILVLGGLLKPKGKDSSLFRPIVEGRECGQSNNSWTSGYVIEANDINSLAWEFVSLVANIRNLVDLEFSSGKVAVDRGTSQMEIFVKGEPSQWELKSPDGSVFCSSSKTEMNKCVEVKNRETKITTISITPVDPKSTDGNWMFTSQPISEVKVYGGLSLEPNPVKLVIDPVNKTVNEGDKVKFFVSLKNADDSTFDTNGFKSVEICATLESNDEKVCISGSGSGSIEVLPSKSDTSIPFTAQLTSKNGEDRRYNVSAVVNVVVQESGKFPSLVCEGGSEGDACKIPDLKNKRSKASVKLRVLEPTDAGAISGQVYIVGFDVTRDDDAREFKFSFTDQNGNSIIPGDKSALFKPNDTLDLEVSFDRGEESQIEGVIEYAVVSNGETVIRQLAFGFSVGDGVPVHILILLLLAAYLLTIAIPYAFLLWSARRNAVLAPPDDEFSYLITPVTITTNGKVVFPGDVEGSSSAITHNNLTAVKLDAGSRMTSVGGAQIIAIPPKLNPLVRSKVLVSIPDSQILTTYGDGTFDSPDALFTPNLVKEAILSFPIEANFAPSVTEQNFVNDNPFAVSTYESEIERSLSVQTGEVTGQAIFFVISSENRRIALRDLKIKIQSLGEASNLVEQIKSIREVSLQESLDSIETDVPESEAETLEDLQIDDSTESSDKRSGLWD
jgi:hypothetical protein